jgi:uncharacterized damage-inducible protein DinB
MKKFIGEITEIFDRDIQKVIDEISKYENEDDLWILPSGINNSAGTLALHIAGNLQHFIGAVMGNSGYERNREEEFDARDLSQNEILSELNKAKLIVHQTLSNMEPEYINENFPSKFQERIITNQYLLIYLSGHLSYHLGQINYHRRLLAD